MIWVMIGMNTQAVGQRPRKMRQDILAEVVPNEAERTGRGCWVGRRTFQGGGTACAKARMRETMLNWGN